MLPHTNVSPVVRVQVQLFAMLRESLGEQVTLEIPQPATVERLLECFAEAYPRFRTLSAYLRVAVDQCYAEGKEILEAGQEIALIPPVSGG